MIANTTQLTNAEVQVHTSAPSPITYLQRLIEYENKRHVKRIKEIAESKSTLEAFETTAIALEALGIRLSLSRLLSYGFGTLYIGMDNSIFDADQHNAPLYGALINLGYCEISCKIYDATAVVEFEKAALKLTVFTTSHVVMSLLDQQTAEASNLSLSQPGE